MEPTIKPIETVYNGYRFRSRLEARWAVFFDTLGVQYEYERDTYQIGADGTRYLPDFYMPDWGKFVEIKPASLEATDKARKCFGLVQYSGKPAVLIFGQPWPAEYAAFLVSPTVEPGISAPHKAAISRGQRTHFAVGSQTGEVYLTNFDVFDTDESAIADLPNIPFVPLCLHTTADIVQDTVIIEFAKDMPDIASDFAAGIELLMGAFRSTRTMQAGWPLADAYLAARQARFEFGERGRRS